MLDTAVGDARNRIVGQVVVCTTPSVIVTTGRAAWKSSHSCASRVASSTALAVCARKRTASDAAFAASFHPSNAATSTGRSSGTRFDQRTVIARPAPG